MTTAVLNTKLSEVKSEISNHDKHIATSEFNKLTTENFPAKLEQGKLVTKTDFDNNLISFNKQITSNKKAK